MSKHRTRGADERAFLVWAKGEGWVLLGRNAAGHFQLHHPESGARTQIPGSFGGHHLRRRIMRQLRHAIASGGNGRVLPGG